jgi:hypothetical protein
MHGPVEDPLIERVADALRRPAPLRPDFDARVMAAVRTAAPAAGGAARAWEWLREPRTLALSPLGGLAMAAGFAGLVFLGTWGVVRVPGGAGAARGAPPVSVITFALVAPQARTVALAGDFDGWDPARLPLRREGAGLWTVDVPLRPGRYQYAFVVDGRRFVADPAAPRAGGDDFGQPTSVVTVAEQAARAAGGAL